MAQDVASLVVTIHANTAKFEAELSKAKLSAEDFAKVVADHKAFLAWIDLGKQAAKVAQAAKPPTDKWRESVETLNQALERGAISQEKFNQARRAMAEKLPALDTGDFKTVSMPSADALGGALKFAAIAGAIKTALDFTNNLIEAQEKLNANWTEGRNTLDYTRQTITNIADSIVKSIPVIGNALEKFSKHARDFIAGYANKIFGGKSAGEIDDLLVQREEENAKRQQKIDDAAKKKKDEKEKDFQKEKDRQQERLKQIRDLVSQSQEMNLSDRQKTLIKAYKLMPGQGVIDEINKQFDLKDSMERAKKLADEQKKLDEETKRKQEQMEKQLADKRKQYIEQSMTPYEKYREQLNEIRQLFGNDPKTKNELEQRLTKKYLDDNFKQGKLNFDNYGLKGAFEAAGINQEFRKSFISFNENQDEDKKQTKILQEIATNTKPRSNNNGFNR